MIEEHTTSSTAVETAKKTPEQQTMRVKIYSPFKVYFDSAVQSISGRNATGPFDVLPEHHKFMTLLSPGELVVHLPKGDEQKFRISGGLMHVKSDQVTVFLDI